METLTPEGTATRQSYDAAAASLQQLRLAAARNDVESDQPPGTVVAQFPADMF